MWILSIRLTTTVRSELGKISILTELSQPPRLVDKTSSDGIQLCFQTRNIIFDERNPFRKVLLHVQKLILGDQPVSKILVNAGFSAFYIWQFQLPVQK